ncbi:hypothetical protein [Paenibacillus sp. NPDC058177]|uniref:hypothetical protein n=1 Tax=Paenibacillus sp. NPDC058177 TaxID=3346369 RepID=UPI0036DF28FA
MGLQLDVNFKGINVEAAYARIELLHGGKESMDIQLYYYPNQTLAGTLDCFQISHFNFVPDISNTSQNYHRQGYEYLKTLTEFKGAIDVLEENIA